MFTFIISILISVGAYHVIKIVFSKKFEKERASRYSHWLALTLFIIIYFGSAYYGFKKPGIVFERSEYETMTNLKIKEGGNIRTLPGKIIKGVGKIRDQSYSYYLLVYLELPSGQQRYFTENNQLIGEELQLERFVAIKDDYGKEWNVKLVPFLPYYFWINR